MAEGVKRKQLRTFRDLQAEDFRHPGAVAATAALPGTPCRDTIASKVMEYAFERLYYQENVPGNVRVTPKMFERLHRSLGWGCKILGVEEPELYIHLDPVPNAFTYGHTRPF